MKQIISIIFFLAIIAACNQKKAPQADLLAKKDSISTSIQKLFDAYNTKNQKAIMSLFSSKGDLNVFGTDIKEYFISYSDWDTYVKKDMELFEKVTFMNLRNLSVEVSGCGGMATAFWENDIDMTTSGKQQTITFRVATTWKKLEGGWRIVQWLGCLPTQQQSTPELLERKDTLKVN